jgi:hypothetical protein
LEAASRGRFLVRIQFILISCPKKEILKQAPFCHWMR